MWHTIVFADHDLETHIANFLDSEQLGKKDTNIGMCDLSWITIAEWKVCVKEGRGGPACVI